MSSLPFFLLLIIVSNAFGAAAFDLSAALDQVQRKRILSVDALIDELPAENFADGGYVLVRHPQGVLGGSPEWPRVILFGGKDSDLLISYASNPRAEGGNRVELIGFDRVQAKFEPAQIRFDPAGHLPPTIYRGAEHPQNQTCVGCHRSDVRPNWDSYPTWRTVFGSGLSGSERETEEKEFAACARHMGHEGRLRRIASTSVGGLEGTNTELSLTLSMRNFRRIVRLLRASPEYSKYRFALWGALFGCDAIDTFLPEPLRPKNVSLAGLNADTLKRILGADTEQERFLNVESLAIVASLRYLLEPRGVDVDSWSMTFERGTYRLRNDFDLAGILDLFRSELPAGSFDEQQWFGYLGSGSNPLTNDRTCSVLKARSLAILN